MKRQFNLYKKRIIYPVKCSACLKYFSKIHIHHKDGNVDNDKISNFILLCESCHAIVHHGIIRKRKYRKILDNYGNPDEDKIIMKLCRLRLKLLRRKNIPKNSQDSIFITARKVVYLKRFNKRMNKMISNFINKNNNLFLKDKEKIISHS